MTRTQFTHMVTLLILYVRFVCVYNPILDYCMRSLPGQKWLFKLGASDCDGVRKKSRHQFGKAIDLYLIKKGKCIYPKNLYRKLHKFWEFLGGKKMISWDIAHFEV